MTKLKNVKVAKMHLLFLTVDIIVDVVEIYFVQIVLNMK